MNHEEILRGDKKKDEDLMYATFKTNLPEQDEVKECEYGTGCYMDHSLDFLSVEQQNSFSMKVRRFDGGLS